MGTATLVRTVNARPVRLKDVPTLSVGAFHEEIVGAVLQGGRLTALFGQPLSNNSLRLFAVLAFAERSQLGLVSCEVADRYPALTPNCTQAHWFEREIAEQWGVVPEGHPWMK